PNGTSSSLSLYSRQEDSSSLLLCHSHTHTHTHTHICTPHTHTHTPTHNTPHPHTLMWPRSSMGQQKNRPCPYAPVGLHVCPAPPQPDPQSVCSPRSYSHTPTHTPTPSTPPTSQRETR